jgi:hypothetical protein
MCAPSLVYRVRPLATQRSSNVSSACLPSGLCRWVPGGVERAAVCESGVGCFYQLLTYYVMDLLRGLTRFACSYYVPIPQTFCGDCVHQSPWLFEISEACTPGTCGWTVSCQYRAAVHRQILSCRPFPRCKYSLPRCCQFTDHHAPRRPPPTNSPCLPRTHRLLACLLALPCVPKET